MNTFLSRRNVLRVMRGSTLGFAFAGDCMAALNMLGEKLLTPAFGLQRFVDEAYHVLQRDGRYLGYALYSPGHELSEGWHFVPADMRPAYENPAREVSIRLRTARSGRTVLHIVDVHNADRRDNLPPNHTESQLAELLGRRRRLDRIEVSFTYRRLSPEVDIDLKPVADALFGLPGVRTETLGTETLDADNLAQRCLEKLLRGSDIDALRLEDYRHNVLALNGIFGLVPPDPETGWTHLFSRGSVITGLAANGQSIRLQFTLYPADHPPQGLESLQDALYRSVWHHCR